MKCVICKKELEGEYKGHNAEPVKIGRCCDDCNEKVVFPLWLDSLLETDKKQVSMIDDAFYPGMLEDRVYNPEEEVEDAGYIPPRKKIKKEE